MVGCASVCGWTKRGVCRNSTSSWTRPTWAQHPVHGPLTLFGSISAAGPLATLNPQRVEGSTHDLIPNSWQVTHATTPHEDDRVLLEAMPLARDIDGDFLAVGKPDAGDFPQGRVRFFRRHRADLQADASLLGALIEDRCLALAALAFPSFPNELIDRGHECLSVPLQGKRRGPAAPPILQKV